jgi:transcriptional regulator GlxA family with amidase domain
MDILPRPDRRIRRIAETIRTDVSRNVDVNVLAKEAGLSRAHFFRLFESSIGVPPRVYLNVMRLERAVEAVLNENGNIGDIGRRLGFDVPAHFTRFFSNHTGVNPRQFRAVSRLAS